MEFLIKHFIDSSNYNIDLCYNPNLEYLLFYQNHCIIIKCKKDNENIFMNSDTKLLNGWHNIEVIFNMENIDIEADVLRCNKFKNEIKHIKITITPTNPINDKEVINEFCNYLKNYRINEKELNILNQINKKNEEEKQKLIKKAEEQLEWTKYTKIDLEEVSRIQPKLDNDVKLNLELDKMFTNYIEKYVKQELLKPEYHIELYNYLLEDNYLYQVVKNFKGSKFNVYCPYKGSICSLPEIDNVVKFMQDKLLTPSRNCARMYTYIYIFNKSFQYYTKYFDSLYGEQFKNIDGLNLNDAILKYIKINPLEDSNEMKNMFIYYLIGNSKFGDDYNKGYIYCREQFIEIYKELKNEHDYNSFISNLVSEKEINKVKYSINDMDLMTGIEFENFIGKLFSRMGYETTVTQASGDQGIDVIVEKNGKKYGVQAKCYSNTVSNSAIQEVVAGITFYKCDKAIVVTNNYFTRSAIDLAKANNVVLWNRDMLKTKINELF